MQRSWVLTIMGVVAVTGVAAARHGAVKSPRPAREAVVLGALPEAALSQAAYRYRTAGPAHWRDCMLKK